MILILSTTAGYYLAGKTLHPIEVVMEKQKRFVADASHELKTPLTALQTSIEVALRDKKLNLNSAKKILSQSLDDINDLTNLSNNLLTLTRLKHNGSEMNFEKVDVAKIIQRAHNKVKPLAKKKNINIKLKTKSLSLKADAESLEKLITILLDNAIKYTDKKGNVAVSLIKSKRHLIIKVTDDGLGISKKDLPHIFDRFYRSDSSRAKDQSDGFGLGLSIAKNIVKFHKGTIGVKSKLGEGSIFIVKLPLNL